MHVVLVAGSYHPREGGAERQMRALFQRLSNKGYRVAVVTQVIPGKRLPRVEDLGGYEVHRVGSKLAFQYLPKLGQGLYTLAAFAKVQSLRPRCLLSLQMGSATVAAAFSARANSIPHVVRLTGGGTAKYRSEPVARANSRVGRLLIRTFWRRSTTLVAPAAHLLDDFRVEFPSFPGTDLQIINGVRLPDEAPRKSEQIVWYGRSGSETSLDILTRIAMCLPDRKFNVMGRADLDDLPANVRSAGWQDEPERFIGQHQVLLNTSASEGMPNTVLQAIAWGCRVVGFDNPGMRELKRMYPDRIILVPHGDIDEACRALNQSMDEPIGVPSELKVMSIEAIEREWTNLLMNGERENGR